MDTHPELDHTHSRLGWRPFGDAMPMPARRRPPPPRRGPGHAALPQRRRAPVSLWLPLVVAVAIGALVGLVALLTGHGAAPTEPDAQVAPLSVPFAGPPAPDGLVVPHLPEPCAGTWCTPPQRLGAPPARISTSRQRQAPAVPAKYAPERVSDLKANPFAPPERIASKAVIAPWHGFRKVSDLKANPYTL